MSLMISISGIRGIFGAGLHPLNLVEFSAAYAGWQKDRGTRAIVVGRDTRTTGGICEDIVCATLRSAGLDVIRVGIAPTPTIAMAVLHHGAGGGIVLSASHNPAEWNALKLLNEKSEFLDEDQGRQVLDRLRGAQVASGGSGVAGGAGSGAGSGASSVAGAGHQAAGVQTSTHPAAAALTWAAWDAIGADVDDDKAVERHIQAILAHPLIDRETIAAAGFRVAVDAVNGAGSLAVPALLQALGAACLPLHCTPDGRFPHNPEPLPAHLGDIREAVRTQQADIGVVTDPDADRLAIVDERGELWGEEYTQAAAFDLVLSHRARPDTGQPVGGIATNLSSSRIADDIASRFGVTCHRSAVGEINVVKAMQAHRCVIGGEGNGGVIDPTLHYGRDALIGIAMVLQLLAERRLTASAYRATLPSYEMSKQKRHLDELGSDADTFLRHVAHHFEDLHPNTIDGVKIDFPEGWVHVRKSNTEPIVRLYAEAPTLAQADNLINLVVSSAARNAPRS